MNFFESLVERQEQLEREIIQLKQLKLNYENCQSKKQESTTTKKTNEQLAKEVIAGKWGGGAARKKALTKAGYNYNHT